MARMVLFLTLLAAASAAPATPGMAQTDLTIPGGATGADAFCIQAGDLATGAFAETFLQTDTGAWEQRSKAATFKFEEKKRDDLVVELFDSSRSASVQFDFVTQTIRQKDSSPAAAWSDRFVILKATDQATSGDCISLAARSAAIDASDADDEESDAADVESSKEPSPKAEKPSNRSKKADRPSKRVKATAREKKKSSPGFSIGIGGGGIGIGF